MAKAGRNYARIAGLFRELVAKEMGLPSTHLVVIDYLLEKGEATPGELAKITGMTTGAMTGVIERLEKHGNVTSERHTKDRRKVVIRPTDKKASLYNHFYYPVVQDIHRIHGTYSVKEIEACANHFEAVAEAFQDAIERMNGKKKK